MSTVTETSSVRARLWMIIERRRNDLLLSAQWGAPSICSPTVVESPEFYSRQSTIERALTPETDV
jgi:hypothetical protein